jgi:hypothetical protein
MFEPLGLDAEMSDAFIKWCRGRTTAQQFLDRVKKFNAAGISLVHPVKGDAVLLDVDGNDVGVSPADIAQLVDRRVGRSLSMEWWFTADIDLTCTYSFVPGGREVQTYYLDGLSPAEVTSVCDLIGSLFWGESSASEWLVVDAIGRLADFDWEDFLLYDAGSPSMTPDLMIVRTSTNAAQIELLPRAIRQDLRNGFVEFKRRD